MSEIEELVKNAINEFGDRAYERFFVSNKGQKDVLHSNSDIDYWIQHCHIKLKPMSELFAHGCDVYGFEQEIKMWEWQDDDNVWNDFSPELCAYDEIIYGMTEYVRRRKTSVARAFCLEDAKAGDVVELNLGDRKVLKFIGESRVYAGFIAVMDEQGLHHVNPESLCMKYPKKLVQS